VWRSVQARTSITHVHGAVWYLDESRTNILITNSGMFGAGRSVFGGLHHENCHHNKTDRFVNAFTLVAALQNGTFYRWVHSTHALMFVGIRYVFLCWEASSRLEKKNWVSAKMHFFVIILKHAKLMSAGLIKTKCYFSFFNKISLTFFILPNKCFGMMGSSLLTTPYLNLSFM